MFPSASRFCGVLLASLALCGQLIAGMSVSVCSDGLAGPTSTCQCCGCCDATESQSSCCATLDDSKELATFPCSCSMRPAVPAPVERWNGPLEWRTYCGEFREQCQSMHKVFCLQFAETPSNDLCGGVRERCAHLCCWRL